MLDGAAWGTGNMKLQSSPDLVKRNVNKTFHWTSGGQKLACLEDFFK